MTKEEILAAAGFPNTPAGVAAFYKKYKSKEDFMSSQQMAYGGIPDLTQYTFGNGITMAHGGTPYYGGPTRPYKTGGPCMDCGGYMNEGGNPSPFNYGAFPVAQDGQELLNFAKSSQQALQQRTGKTIPADVRKYIGAFEMPEPGQMDSVHVFQNDPRFGVGFKGTKAGVIPLDPSVQHNVNKFNKPYTVSTPPKKGERDVYFNYMQQQGGGFMDDGSYPMMNYGGDDLTEVFKSNKRAKGGDVTSQGGNQNIIKKQQEAFLGLIQNNVHNNMNEELHQEFVKAYGGVNDYSDPSVDALRNSYFADKTNRNNAQYANQQNFNSATNQFANNMAPIIAQNVAMNSMFEGAVPQAQAGKVVGKVPGSFSRYDNPYNKTQAQIDAEAKAQDDAERALWDDPYNNPQTQTQQQQASNQPWNQQLADAFGPNSRKNGLPYFPANLNKSYGLSNKNYDKLYGMTQNDTLKGVSMEYGPLARGKFGRKLFGPKKVSLDFNKFVAPGTGRENVDTGSMQVPFSDKAYGGMPYAQDGISNPISYPRDAEESIGNNRTERDMRGAQLPANRGDDKTFTPDSVAFDRNNAALKQAVGQYASPLITNWASNIDARKNKGRDEAVMQRLFTPGSDLSSIQAIPGNAMDRGDYDVNSGRLQPNNYNPAIAHTKFGGTLAKALSGLEVKMQNMRPGLYGTNGNRQFSLPTQIQSSRFSEPDVDVRGTLEPVDREDANLEAEKGETAVVNVGGMSAHFKIGGERHSNGGTPLNLPDNSFIFSDTAKMKIKDATILVQFGMMPKKGGYTPADIAKKYDINKFRKVLANNDSEPVEKKTAEMMIANYNLKLAKLALIQESIKGFPQGIPVMAMPYIESNEIDASTFLPDQAQEQQEGAEQPDAETGEARYGANIIAQWATHQKGGRVAAGFHNPFAEVVGFNKPAIGPLGPGRTGTEYDEDFFAEDPETSDVYAVYKEAMQFQGSKEEKLAKLTEAQKKLEAIDVPNSLGFLPFTKQDKLQDLAGILEEARYAITHPFTKGVTQAESDKLYANKAKETYDYARYLYLKETDPSVKLDLSEDIKKLEKLHPEYRKTHADSPTQPGSAAYYAYMNATMPGAVSKPPIKVYSKEEAEDILKMNNDYRSKINKITGTVEKTNNIADTPKELSLLQPKPDYSKSGKVDEYFPSDNELLNMGPKELAKWDSIYATTHPTYERKQGGAIEQYAPGGETPSEKQARLKRERAARGTKGNTDPYNPGEEKRKSQDLTETAIPDTEGNIPLMIRPYYGSDAPTKYTPEEWREFAKSTGFKPKTKSVGAQNREFQDYLAAHPDWGPKIDALHKEHGRPKEGKFDALIGKRWDALLTPGKKPVPPPAKSDRDIIVQPKGPIQDKTKVAFKRYPPVGVNPKPYAPWWLQDIVKTSGAALDLARVKKYNPWQAQANTYLPDATLYDPTRELAANTEQANLASQFHQAFTGPKSGAISGVQGKSLGNAADIMSKYNNLNVGVLNQLSQDRSNIMNTASQNKANMDTQLFDKYTIANQQFDSTKNMARQNLRQSYVDALTNRGKTQALNTLYPNYYTDPSSGGFVNFNPGYGPIDPNQPKGNSYVQQYKELMEVPGMTHLDAMDILKKNGSAKDDTKTDNTDYTRGYPG